MFILLIFQIFNYTNSYLSGNFKIKFKLIFKFKWTISKNHKCRYLKLIKNLIYVEIVLWYLEFILLLESFIKKRRIGNRSCKIYKRIMRRVIRLIWINGNHSFWNSLNLWVNFEIKRKLQWGINRCFKRKIKCTWGVIWVVIIILNRLKCFKIKTWNLSC
jgi:hypothetical protein